MAAKNMLTAYWSLHKIEIEENKFLFLALKGGRSMLLPSFSAKNKNWWVSNDKIYTVKTYIHFKRYTGTMNHVSIYNVENDFFFSTTKFNINEKVRPLYQVQQFLELLKCSLHVPALPFLCSALAWLIQNSWSLCILYLGSKVISLTYMTKNLNKNSICYFGIDLISNLWLAPSRVTLVCKVGHVINSFESHVFICTGIKKKLCLNICTSL